MPVNDKYFTRVIYNQAGIDREVYCLNAVEVTLKIMGKWFIWRHKALVSKQQSTATLQWRHNGRDSVSNHQPHDCLLNRLFRRRSKKTSKLSVTGRWPVNSPHKWPVTRKMFPFDDVILKIMCIVTTENDLSSKCRVKMKLMLSGYTCLLCSLYSSIFSHYKSENDYAGDGCYDAIYQHRHLMSVG